MPPRERQLFKLKVQGMINEQIPYRLCISVGTVEVHRAKMMARQGPHLLAELVKTAGIPKTPSQ